MKARMPRTYVILTVLMVLLTMTAVRAEGSTPSVSAQQTNSGSIVINEVMPNPANGPEWVELTLPTHQVFIPLVLRDSSGGSASTASTKSRAPTVPSAGPDLSGYEITDEDGNTYTIPDALPPLPIDGFIVIYFGDGTDDYDFSDGYAELYTGDSLAGSLGDKADQVSLYAGGTHNADNTVDFVAWGAPPEEDGTNGVDAGVWQEHWFVNQTIGSGAREEGASARQGRGIGRRPGADREGLEAWTVYQDDDLSPGMANPVPYAYWSNVGDTVEMSRDGFALGWSLTSGARYRLQMDDNADFSSPEVDTILDAPLYAPDTAPPVGDYWWRVQTINGGGSSSWSPARQVTLIAGETAGQVHISQTILNNMNWLRQRKDTPLLCLDGDPLGNPDDPAPKRAWDATHPDNIFTHGRNNCVRASIAMMVTNYGGDLSQDRLSYRLFENFGNPIENRGGVGNVQADLGHNRATLVCGPNGASATTLMTWALGVNNSAITYSGGKPSWNQVTTWINNGRPIMRYNNNHQTVIGGYRTLNNGTQQIRLFDPWSGLSWQTYSNLSFGCHYVGPTSASNVRSDEVGIWSDLDDDGIMDWDERTRFNTSVGDSDSDDDWVDDKLDIRSYVFGRYDSYNLRNADIDGDGDRKEVDCDNDNDGSPDGCEDTDQDGKLDVVGETDPFDAGDSQMCVPRIDILDPTTNNDANVGAYDDPLKFLIRLKLTIPPCGTMPSLSPNDFEFSVGGSARQYPINGFKVGQEYWLLAKPPNQTNIGDYDLTVYYDFNARTDKEEDAVDYTARLRTDNVLVIDTSGSMSDYNKLPAAKNASRLFIDQSITGEMIGAVTFSSTTSVPYSLTEITSAGTEQADAKSAVDALSAGGLTAMGSGLLEGQNQFDTYGTADHAQTLVLLGDGMENVAPYWSDPSVRNTLNNAGTTVHSVGVGPADAAWYSRLSAVASDTGGEFWPVNQFATQTSVNVREADITAAAEEAGVELQQTSSLFPSTLDNRLADVYKAIAETLTRTPRLWQATDTLDESNSQRIHAVELPSGLSEVRFTGNWDDPNAPVNVSLRRPDGTVVNPGDTDLADHKVGDTHEHFRITQPAGGTWEFTLTYTGGESTEYIAFAAAPSEVTMGHAIGASPDERVVDNQIPIVVYLADEAPILGAEITGEIAHPDFVFEQLTFYDDGEHGDGEPDDGVYGTLYRPWHTGVHELKIEGDGTDNAGTFFNRYLTAGFNVRPRAAYLYTNQTVATQYETLLEDHGMTVDLVPMTDVPQTSYDPYQLLIAGPDTGSFDSWGTPDAVSAISQTNKSIVGLGEGGYALFGELDLDIGYPYGAHGDENQVVVVNADHPVYSSPYPITSVTSDTLTLYDSTSHVGIYMPDPPGDVDPLGQETQSSDHYPLVADDYSLYLLWGFEASPSSMTETGRRTFVNTSWHMQR